MDTKTDATLETMQSNLETLYIVVGKMHNTCPSYGYMIARIDSLNHAIAEHVQNSQGFKYRNHTSMAA